MATRTGTTCEPDAVRASVPWRRRGRAAPAVKVGVAVAAGEVANVEQTRQVPQAGRVPRGAPGQTGAPGTAPPVQVGGAEAQAQAQGFGGRGGPPNVLNAQPGDQYRFNWNTPVIMSPHNPKIVWLGGNRLFKSFNQGDTWVASADLTKNVDRNKVSLMGAPGDRTQLSRNDGVVAYSTIIAISESPVL